MECICRQGAAARGERCRHVNHPTETCLVCDTWADYFVGNGDARYISKDEAKDLLRRAEREGLLIETANTDSTDTICMCCSCCCGPLKLLRASAGAARDYAGNYVCVKDEALCTHCLKCTERCVTDALVKAENGKPALAAGKCVGCGLCVSACPAKALKLVVKPEAKLNIPFRTVDELQSRLAEERLAES
ncbi:MAG: 4Fe-4S binding protein [Gracilibacteraceae bacterium]|jgi:Pyruvate/2-oxoacid:ferredoxin oxidoreductase delta subunit|nr:4Fe-4S binding protein [Gracilibacteraceae bacterium]